VTAIILALTALLLLLTRIIGVRQMLMAIILVRPSCDRVLDVAKAAFGQSSGPGAAINALMIAMAIVALVHVPEAILSAPLLAWGSFLLLAAASLLHTANLRGGTQDFLDIVTYAAAFVLPYVLVNNGKAVARCLTVALASSVVPSAFALVEIAMRPAILTGSQRLQSTFTHPNIFAFYIVGEVTLLLYLRCSTRFKLSASMRRAAFAYAVYLVFLLLLTTTRSAWLAMLLIMAGYSIVVDRRWLLPLLALPATLLIPGVSDRLSDLEFGTIDGGFTHLNSLAWRQVLWDDTFKWLANNPPGFFGYGLGSFQSYLPLFFSRGKGLNGVGPHNAFLQIYFEMGIAGLASFVFLLATVATRLISGLGKDFAGCFTGLMLCIGFVIVCYSDNLLGYLQFEWFFWFTMGTMCASARLANELSHARCDSTRFEPALSQRG